MRFPIRRARACEVFEEDMNQINLFFLTDVKYGGFATYTAHLAKAFEQQGWMPIIFKIRSRTESTARPWAHGLWSMNLSLEDAIGSARTNPTIVTCAYWKKEYKAIARLLSAGAGLVLHDPTEYHRDLISLLNKLQTKVISIRKTNDLTLRKAGVNSTFIPHPFVRTAVPDVEKKHHAVAISRVDWDKHTEIIAEANQKLPERHRCAIYGAENRMYAHHKLDSQFPDWQDNYYGKFPHGWSEASKLAAGAKWVVDMSVIKGDGGGTQYTFMEAFDVGTPLVLNKGWLRGDDTTLKDGVNCTAGETPGELASLLSGHTKINRNKLIDGGKRLLQNHTSELTVERVSGLYGW